MTGPVLQMPDAPSPQPPPALQNLQPPAQPAPQPQHGQYIININWSLFKPEFSGKPKGDVKAHLL